MSYIAVGVTAAGVVMSVASKAMEKKGGGTPAFDYQSGERELGRLRDQLGGKAKQLGDYFAAHSGGMPTGIMPAASGQTAEHEAQALADASAFNTQQNTAQGAVRSFGDVWGDIGRDSVGDKTRMTNILDFKKGSQALLPGEMQPIINRQAPQITAGDFGGMYKPGEEPDNTFSDILGGAGSIATSYGMSGMGGGASPFGAGGGWSTGLDGYGARGMPKFGGPR
jgi:hypothetical protein